MNDGRTGEAPFQLLVVVGSRSQHAKVLLPQQGAFEVIAKQSFGTEKSYHVLPVCCGGAVGMRRLHVSLDGWFPHQRVASPDDSAGVEFQTDDLPGPLSFVGSRLARSTQPAGL